MDRHGACRQIFGALTLLDRPWRPGRSDSDSHMPGDDVVLQPVGVIDQAISIAAPPEMVWDCVTRSVEGRWFDPLWVATLGSQRPAVGTERTTADPGIPMIGDVLTEESPGTDVYWVLSADQDNGLVLYATAHLPAWLGDRWWFDRTWALRLEPIRGGESTRLRLRVRGAGSLPLRIAWHLVIAPGNRFIARSLLRRIKQDAEQAA